jgi:hypothetical protein
LEPLRDLERVELYEGIPNFAKVHRRASGAKGAGLRYEDKTQRTLTKTFADAGLQYLPSPWFRYWRKSSPMRENFAQPDGFCPDHRRGIIFLVEIKLKHTIDSYFQLLDKYTPLLEKFFNNGEKLWRIAPIEVCRWYDPRVLYPCKIAFQDDILLCDPREVSVHVCRPS